MPSSGCTHISAGCWGKTFVRMIFAAPPIFTIVAKWTGDRRIRFSAGWGTLLTNDFRGCNPNDGDGFDPISLICKVSLWRGVRR